MAEFFNCDNCNQLIQRAHINEGKPYCVQCLSHKWQKSDESDEFGESEALFLLETPVDVPEVEILNEALVLVR
ncbi:MAG: hypothetical protein HY819_23480 [Acidobacteria bacterium]|nr:hypothetical protein [Acidobacteriota bacterium]